MSPTTAESLTIMDEDTLDRLLRAACLVGASVVLSKSDCTSDAGGLAQLEAIRDHLYEGLTTGHAPRLLTHDKPEAKKP